MQERVCDRRRFNRRNSDSFKSCNRLKSFDQSHKIHVSLTVLPDIYPCQNNLSISAVSKQCGFLYHVFQQATSFTTSGERDETKTAHDVAAVLDLEQRSCGVRFAIFGQDEVITVDRSGVDHVRSHLFFQCLRGGKKRRQIPFELISDDEIDTGDVAQLIDSGLSVATGDFDEFFRRMTYRIPNDIAASTF